MNALSSIRSVITSLSRKGGDENEDDMAVVNRYSPISLEDLASRTRYTPQEIQLIYRAFKSDSPTAIIYEDKFKELYSYYFPLGDARAFAGYIFSVLDHDRIGFVNFEQFLVAMSILTRGELNDKLRWIFNLYDLNADGRITPDELCLVLTAVHEMLGFHTSPLPNDHFIKTQAARIFQKMDRNKDGVITLDEFTETCLQRMGKLVDSLERQRRFAEGTKPNIHRKGATTLRRRQAESVSQDSALWENVRGLCCVQPTSAVQ